MLGVLKNLFLIACFSMLVMGCSNNKEIKAPDKDNFKTANISKDNAATAPPAVLPSSPPAK